MEEAGIVGSKEDFDHLMLLDKLDANEALRKAEEHHEHAKLRAQQLRVLPPEQTSGFIDYSDDVSTVRGPCDRAPVQGRVDSADRDFEEWAQAAPEIEIGDSYSASFRDSSRREKIDKFAAPK